MEGDAPEQPQSKLEEANPQEAITSGGIRVRLTRRAKPQEVDPTLYDKTGNPVPPQIIGEALATRSKPVKPEERIIDKKA